MAFSSSGLRLSLVLKMGAARWCVATGFNKAVGKILLSSVDETASGAASFVAKLSLYSNSLDVAYCFAEAWQLSPEHLSQRYRR
jgi:hypothetical protein